MNDVWRGTYCLCKDPWESDDVHNGWARWTKMSLPKQRQYVFKGEKRYCEECGCMLDSDGFAHSQGTLWDDKFYKVVEYCLDHNLKAMEDALTGWAFTCGIVHEGEADGGSTCMPVKERHWQSLMMYIKRVLYECKDKAK